MDRGIHVVRARINAMINIGNGGCSLSSWFCAFLTNNFDYISNGL